MEDCEGNSDTSQWAKQMTVKIGFWRMFGMRDGREKNGNSELETMVEKADSGLVRVNVCHLYREPFS